MALGPRPAGRLRRGWRLGCALAVLVVTATATSAGAAFSDSFTVATAVATDRLAPPSGLTVVQTCTPSASIAFRAASSAKGSTSLTLPTPAGTVAGDVLVAQVANRYEAYPLSAPSGWTLIFRDTSGAAVTSALFWRVATATEPSGATFTLSGVSGVQMAGGIAAYSGVSTTNPVNASGTTAGHGPTVSTASVTTTAANTLLLHTVTKRQEDLAAPTGTTERWRLMSGNGTATEGASAGDERFAGPGATAPRVSTSSANFSTEWVSHTVALRPLPGTPSAAATWTAAPQPWATGYRLDRIVAGTVQATRTVPLVSATYATDGPLANGTTYTYELRTYFASWTSVPLTVTLAAAC